MNLNKIEVKLKSFRKEQLKEICKKMIVTCDDKNIINQLLKPLKTTYKTCGGIDIPNEKINQNLLDEIVTAAQEYADNNNKKSLIDMLKCFDEMYYEPTFEGGIPDDIYEQLVDIYDAKFGKNKTYHEIKGVGAGVINNNNVDIRKDVKLPYHMGTILKFVSAMLDPKKGISEWSKPIYKRKFTAWKNEYPGPFTIEGKADGISCLLIYQKINDNKIKRIIYTRGTGTTGKDLSRYVDKFSLIPNGNEFEFPKDKKIVIRGELVMRNKVWKKKYSKEYSNPRNIVAGFVTKKQDTGVSPTDIDFIAYELLVPRDKNRYDQIQELQKIGFVTVETTQISKTKLTEPKLFEILKDFRHKSPYEIDGLVVFDDSKVRPVSKVDVLKSAFAYKVNMQTAVVDVVGVEWTSSTTNALKPVVIYKPVKIGRVMEDGSVVGGIYRRATGFNANFINENKIGPGSKLLIIRSGDVIPYIGQILGDKRKNKIPDMPNKKRKSDSNYHYKGHDEIEYEWGDGKNRRSTLDIFAVDDLDSSKIQRLNLFFSGGRQKRGINIKGIAKKTIKTLYDNGLNTITKILQASESDLTKALGKKTEKSKLAFNIRKSIDDRFSEPIDLAILMGATQIFPHARGRTVQKILDKYPNVLTNPPKKLENVKGVGQDALNGFLEALPKFKKFLKDNPQIKIFVPVKSKIKGKFSGKFFVFTGKMEFGSREESQNLIKKLGGEISNGITKKVNYLVIGNLGGGGKKIQKAENLGIKIISENEFLKMINKK